MEMAEEALTARMADAPPEHVAEAMHICLAAFHNMWERLTNEAET